MTYCIFCDEENGGEEEDRVNHNLRNHLKGTPNGFLACFTCLITVLHPQTML